MDDVALDIFCQLFQRLHFFNMRKRRGWFRMLERMEEFHSVNGGIFCGISESNFRTVEKKLMVSAWITSRVCRMYMS